MYTTAQQILATKTFDNSVQRIAVLLRAADLLWPHQEEKARAAFMEAFDLASQNFKETGEVVRQVSEKQFAARIQMLEKLDFDGSLAQATTFADKSLRALTTLAVIEPCLQQTPKAKPRKAKT